MEGQSLLGWHPQRPTENNIEFSDCMTTVGTTVRKFQNFQHTTVQ